MKNGRYVEIKDSVDYGRLQQKWRLEWSCGPTHLIKRRIITEILRDFNNRNILDTGCGNGYYSCFLEGGNCVVSMDVSLTSVKITRENRLKKQCLVGKTESLCFPAQYFDIVLALDILEHVEDDRKAVNEISRVLRKGGKIVFSAPEDMGLFSQLDIENGHFRRYSKEDLANRVLYDFRPVLLSDFGFPFMKMYIRMLSKFHAIIDAPSKFAHSPIARFLSRILVLLFSIELPFNGSFRGIELYGVFEKAQRPSRCLRYGDHFR